MEFANQKLIEDWTEFNTALKVWLFADRFGDRLPDLQARYPNPSVKEIDDMFHRIMQALRKDSKPLVKY